MLLGVSRWQIKRHGLKAVQQHLGERMTESPCEISQRHTTQAERIGWAVTHVSIYTPWTSNCFPKAVAAKRLLDRHGIAATVYFGATRHGTTSQSQAPATESFAAHAWTRCGEIILTGGDVMDDYEPIVWYSNTADVSLSQVEALDVTNERGRRDP